MIAKALVLSLLLLQADVPSSPFTGDGLSGGGRACNGSLRIYPTYINWETSFSTCDHMPYKTIQASKDGPWIYQFTTKKKGCISSVLRVRRPTPEGGFWYVSGWPSVRAAQDRKILADSDCPMY